MSLHLACNGSSRLSHHRRLDHRAKLSSTRRQPENAPSSTWQSECATPPASRGHAARQRKLKAAADSAEVQASQDLAAPPPPPPPPPAQEQQQQQQQVPKPASPGPTTGLIYLLLVALLWGSYTPALRLAYSLPGPPTPVALTAASGVLELIVLLAALVLGSSLGGGSKRAAAQAAEAAQRAQQAGQEQQAQQQQAQQQAQQEGKNETVGGAALPGSSLLLLGLPAVVLGGMEIGAYNAVGTFSQVSGLSMTTAARAAFLVQASTLFTPILSSLAGSVPARSVWLGSLIAFAGTLIITTDQSGGGADVAPTSASMATADVALAGADVAAHVASAGADAAATGAAGAAGAAAGLGLPLGDVLTLAAALCYAAATVRIPVWAVRYRVPAVQLALGKIVVLTAVAAAGLALQAAQVAGDGQALESLWPGWRQPEGWALVTWAALGPGALASVLLVKGQSLVSPTAAQIVFCSVPLCSALLAAVVLPDEPVGTATWLGGAVVVAGGLVASLGRTRA